MKEIEIDQRALTLIDQITASRQKLESYSNDVEAMKDKVLSIFPSDITARNKFLLDDKLKITSSFYSTMLSLRQEINKSLKTEFDLITKFKPADNSEEDFDVRKMADEVDKELKSRKITANVVLLETKTETKPDENLSLIESDLFSESVSG